MNYVIAIDGPAGSGKGTITKIVADKLNLVYIDTGATYRCVALASLRDNIKLEETDKIINLAKTLDIDFDINGHKLFYELQIVRNCLPKETKKITIEVLDYIKMMECCFPNVWIVHKILFTIPVIVASTERSF